MDGLSRRDLGRWGVSAALLCITGCRGEDELTPVRPPPGPEVRPTHPAVPVPETCPPTCPPDDATRLTRVSRPNPIPAENARPGERTWRDGRVSWARQLEVYTDVDSVRPGESVGVRASADGPGRVRAEVYRLGWYGGAGARRVWSEGTFEVRTQADPRAAPETGLVACAWDETLRIPVGEDWVSGLYLVKLIRDDGYKRFAPFVVRDDRAAEVLLQAAFHTYQAYNFWGDNSLYASTLASLPAGRASHVSYDRPYRDDEGAGQVLRWEMHLARFLERHGHDVTYGTNLDFERHSNLLDGIGLFVHGGHDEYWTSQQRAQLDAALGTGAMGLAHFGGNGGYWRVRLEPNAAGEARRTIVCFKNQPQEDPEPGSTVRFRDEPSPHPESLLFGAQYDNWQLIPFPLVVSDPAHWLFEGTGLQQGALLHGLVGYEFDRVPTEGVPAGLRVSLDSPVVTAEGIPSRSQVVDRTLPSGRLVFSAGTIYWPLGLSDDPELYDARVARMTLNVLERGLSHRRPAQVRTPQDPSIPALATPQPRWAQRVEALVGQPGGGFRDGPGHQALFLGPTGLAVMSDGTLVVADTGNHRVRLVGTDGQRTVLTAAGNGLPGFRDGPGGQAMFRSPTGVAVGPDGALYVADSDNHVIRRLVRSGGEWTVSTWAGGVRSQGFRDGAADQARFRRPTALVADRDGNLYVADQAGNRLRFIDAVSRQVRTLAGDGSGSLFRDAERGEQASFNNPSALALGLAGELYVLDAWQRVRRVETTGAHQVRSLAGRPSGALGFADGTGTEARFRAQMGMAVLDTGHVLVADTANHRLRKVVPGADAASSQVFTFAGSGRVGTRLGRGDEADLVCPAGLVVARDGSVIVSDAGNHVLRRVVV